MGPFLIYSLEASAGPSWPSRQGWGHRHRPGKAWGPAAGPAHSPGMYSKALVPNQQLILHQGQNEEMD